MSQSLAEQLREQIRLSEMSANALARESGVPQPMITNFLNGKDIRLETANKLAAYFGLSLQPARKASKAKRRRLR